MTTLNDTIGWLSGSEERRNASEMVTAIIAEVAGRSGYNDYGGHSSVSYGGGHGGYGSMAKYIDPFTVLAFAIFGAFLTYIYFYCIIKKNCIQFASCAATTGSGPRRSGSNSDESEQDEDAVEFYSFVERLITAASEAWASEFDDDASVM